MMAGMARTDQVATSSAASFPVYGLEESTSAVRWLDSFGDVIGAEVRWVRLAHQDPDTGALTMVATYSRPLTDAQASRRGVASLQSVAAEAAAVLVNLTLPAGSVVISASAAPAAGLPPPPLRLSWHADQAELIRDKTS